MFTRLFFFTGIFGIASYCAAQEWPRIELVGLPVSLQEPVDMHEDVDSGLFYVAGRRGTIWRFAPEDGEAELFAELDDLVESGDLEQGLQAFLLAPDFSSSGQFYVYYIRRDDSAAVLSRFTAEADSNPRDVAATEETLLVVEQPSVRHHGGGLAFGPDGYLYLGIGDGGLGPGNDNPAQDPGSLLGKIIRIDPLSTTPYAIPVDNPFIGDASYRPEIWAVGLRNPWRMAFDSTGRLFLTDVGENDWEEINIIAPGQSGQNFGWPYYEGEEVLGYGTQPDSHTAPTIALPHNPQDGLEVAGSIIGGFPYEGTVPPEDTRIEGAYIFGDWNTGKIYAAKQIEDVWQYTAISNDFVGVSGFGRTADGTLYVLDLFGGSISRIDIVPRSHAPKLSRSSYTSYSPFDITVTNLSDTARMYYTWEDRDPTEDDTPVANGEVLRIDRAGTLRLIAFEDGVPPSEVVHGNYTLRLRRPSASPTSYSNSQDQIVTLTASDTEGRVYYTLDGSTPTLDDAWVPSGGTILIDRTSTLKARAYIDNYALSEVYTSTYTFHCSKPDIRTTTIVRNGTVAFPASRTPDAVTYFTTDGTEATAESPVLPSEMAFTETTTLSLFTSNGRYDDEPPFTVTIGVVNYVPDYISVLFAGSETSGYLDGPGLEARFDNITGICSDAVGNLYVSDADNHRIRKIDPEGNVTTYAGSGGTVMEDGPRMEAGINAPGALRFSGDSDLHFFDGRRLRSIEDDGSVSSWVDLPSGSSGYGLKPAPDGTFVILADRSFYSYIPGATTTSEMYVNASLSSALWNGFAVDDAGQLFYFTHSGVFSIFNVVDESGNVTWLIDQYGTRGDGPLDSAQLVSPDDLIFQNGRGYFSDDGAIRMIVNGEVRTLVGDLNDNGPTGIGPNAKLVGMSGLAVTPGNRIFAVLGNAIYEIKRGTDTDADGIFDEIEASHPGLIVGRRDDLVDDDHDGRSNYEELMLGMDSENSHPGSPLEVIFSSTSDWVYSVTWSTSDLSINTAYYSEDLVNWVSLGSNGVNSLSLEIRALPRLFFKVEAVDATTLYGTALDE